jgi:hypothetical protein
MLVNDLEDWSYVELSHCIGRRSWLWSQIFSEDSGEEPDLGCFLATATCIAICGPQLHSPLEIDEGLQGGYFIFATFVLVAHLGLLVRRQ